MSCYAAFLRAINVGGHTVKMDALRRLFESFGFSEVETFIASGNVIFNSTEQDAKTLESIIASGLKTALGFEVSAFIRTPLELAEIAAYPAFPQPKLDAATAFNIVFLASPLDDQAKKKLMALTTNIDNFAVHAREVYWLCCKKQSESTFSNVLLDKTLGVKSTIRGISTICKLADRWAPQSSSVGPPHPFRG